LSSALWISSAADAQEFRNPVPATVSPQAQALLRSLPDPATYPKLPEASDFEAWRKLRREEAAHSESKILGILARYEPAIETRTCNGVPVLEVRPRGWLPDPRVIVFIHGGGYVLGSARTSLPASVPLAADAGMKLISIDYTTIPFATYDEILQQIISVVLDLKRAGHELTNIGFVGVSAGGGLAAGAALKMRDDGIGMPAAIVLWSPATDLAEHGETFVTLRQFEPAFDYREVEKISRLVVPQDRLRAPYVSPVYGDFTRGYSPTLIQGGTREILLSNFVRLYQAMDTGGVSVKLDLYEGMVHTFQEVAPDLPESALARAKTARFLLTHISR
jgi:acetyl esterase/lipase